MATQRCRSDPLAENYKALDSCLRATSTGPPTTTPKSLATSSGRLHMLLPQGLCTAAPRPGTLCRRELPAPSSPILHSLLRCPRPAAFLPATHLTLRVLPLPALLLHYPPSNVLSVHIHRPHGLSQDRGLQPTALGPNPRPCFCTSSFVGTQSPLLQGQRPPSAKPVWASAGTSCGLSWNEPV